MEVFLKKYINRIISIFLILVMLGASLTGCKKTAKEDNSVFAVSNLNVPGAETTIDAFKMFPIDNGDIFYGGNALNSNQQNIEHFYYLNNKGEVDHSFNLNFFDGRIVDISFDNDGTVYVLLFGVVDNEDESNVTDDSADGALIAESLELGPQTNSKFLEDKLGYSLFNKKYDAVVAKKLLELEQKKKEQASLSENDENSSIVEGDYDNTEDWARDGGEESGEDYGNFDEYGLTDEEPMTVSETKPECGYTITINPVEKAEDYGFGGGFSYYGGEEGEAENKEQKQSYLKLIKISNDGVEISANNISDDSEVIALFKEGLTADTFSNIVYDQNKLYLVSYQNILCFDTELNYESNMLAKDIADELTTRYEFIRNNNGKLYIWFANEPNYDVYTAQIDFANKKLINKTRLVDERYYVRICSGSSMDFSICKNGFLYGYNIGDSEYTKQVDFMASDLSTDYVASVGSVDNDHFYAVYRTIDDGKTNIGFFSKSADNTNSSKKELSLVVVSSNSEIQKAVVQFNKSSEEYRIRLIDYNAMYGTEDYWASDAVYEKLNTDIIAGNMPDMILLDSNLPVQTYINKGILENLYPFIENDSEFTLADFNEHVLSVMANDDKLYSLAPQFTVRTVIAPKSILNGKTTWTIKEAQEIYKNSKALAFFAFMDRASMLELVIALSGDTYVNVDKGTCDFNNQDFKDTLDFIKSFPSQMDYNDALSEKLFNNYETMFRDGLVIGDIVEFYSASQYLYEIYGKYGKDYQNIGFPMTKGNGISFNFPFSIAMSALSDNKDGCWQFLRYFLTDDYQNNIGENGFPLKNSAFDISMGYATKNPPMYHAVYEGVSYDNEVTYWMGEEQHKLDPLSKEDQEIFMNLIDSIETSSTVDKKIMSILNEESEQYFNNKSTLDEAINNIQSRVQIYLYESQ